MKKILQSKRTVFLVLFLVVVVIWILNFFKVFGNHPPLYCEAKNRVLTNEEFIIAALENRYKYNAVKIDDSTKTAKDFYKKYPNCCKVGRRPPLIKRNFMGDLYDENQGHIMMTMFYPTSESRLANLIRLHATTWPDGHPKYIDKTYTYTEDTFQMSDCGDVGKSTHEFLNIKDTPFANNLDK